MLRILIKSLYWFPNWNKRPKEMVITLPICLKEDIQTNMMAKVAYPCSHYKRTCQNYIVFHINILILLLCRMVSHNFKICNFVVFYSLPEMRSLLGNQVSSVSVINSVIVRWMKTSANDNQLDIFVHITFITSKTQKKLQYYL